LATGWYWNPAQAGTGVFFEEQGGAVFLAAFLYRAAAAGGTAAWYASNGTPTSTSAYTGQLYEYNGGAPLSLLLQSSLPSVIPMVGAAVVDGTISLTAATTAQAGASSTAATAVGTLVLPSRSVALSKFNF
jgi:hypothetical protein